MLLTDSNIYNMRHLEAVKKNLPRRSKEIPTTASVVAYDIKNFKTCLDAICMYWRISPFQIDG